MKKLIVFTIDNNYIKHLAVALVSFIESNNPKEFDIGVIYKDIPDFEMNKLKVFFFNQGLIIISHRIKNFLSEIPAGHHFNEVVFYRFLAPEIFSDYDSLLYIDSDVIFLSSIEAIFELDISEKILAAVDRTPYFGIPDYMTDSLTSYFAAGLLYINVKNYNSNLVKEKCIKFLKTHYFRMADQDALNFVVRDFISIDPSYSVETAFLDKLSDFDFVKDPKIIQFSGGSKPWHLNNKHPYKKLYWVYRNKTPYKSFFPDDFGFFNLVRYLLPSSLKRIVKLNCRKIKIANKHQT